MTYTSSTCITVAAILACSVNTIFAQETRTESKASPVVLVYKGGKALIVHGEHRSFSEMQELFGAQADGTTMMKLPELDRAPASSRIESLEGNPHYTERLVTYSRLAERQRQLDAMGSDKNANHLMLSYDAMPLLRMFDRWSDYAGVSIDKAFYETDMEGKKEEIGLGILIKRQLYGNPPESMEVPPDFKKVVADGVKPFLFHIDDKYYSVYGDTEVAQHIALKEYPKNLAALICAGNPLFACSKELPPALQSVGAGTNGVIWLADLEGHIAFFSTRDRKFFQETHEIEGLRSLRIPRMNFTSSIFAMKEGDAEYEEYHLDVGNSFSVAKNPRHLPHDVVQVLSCDQNKIVFVTKRVAYDMRRNESRSKHIELLNDEMIVEGLYVDESEEIALLVGKVPKKEDYPWEERQTWLRGMRPIRLDFTQ